MNFDANMSQDRSDIKLEGMDELKGLWPSFSDDDSGYNESNRGSPSTVTTLSSCSDGSASSDCSSHRSTPPIAEELDLFMQQQPLSTGSSSKAFNEQSDVISDVISQDGGWLCDVIGSSDIGHFTDAYNSFTASSPSSPSANRPTSASPAKRASPSPTAFPTGGPAPRPILQRTHMDAVNHGNRNSNLYYGQYQQQQQLHNNQFSSVGRGGTVPSVVSAPLLNGNENLNDALVKIIRIAGNRMPEAYFSSGNGTSMTSSNNAIDVMIKECNTIENLLWHQVYNVIKEELEFKQSPFFATGGAGIGGMPAPPPPCGPPNGVLPMPPPPPPMMPPQCLLPPPPPPPPPHHHALHQMAQPQRQVPSSPSWTVESPYSRPKISSKTQFQDGRYHTIPRWA